MGQTALAEQGETIQPTQQDIKDRNSAQRKKRLHSIFATVAVGLNAVAAYYVIKEPQTVVDLFSIPANDPSPTDISEAAFGWKIYFVAMASMFSSIATTPLWGYGWTAPRNVSCKALHSKARQT